MNNYDSAMQMFVQSPRPVDMSRLSFMRWLAEHGRLEHRVEGPASGAFVAGTSGSPEGPQSSNSEMPLGSAMPRNDLGITKFTADLGGLGKDSVQLGAPPEGGLSLRFRR